MRQKTVDYFVLVSITIIILLISWYFRNEYLLKVESFRGDQVTDQPNPEAPAPQGVREWSYSDLRNNRTVVENDLYPAPTPSTSEIIINPRPPLWRVPQHPTIVPSVGDGGAVGSFIEWLPTWKMEFPWTSFIFREFPPVVIETWLKDLNDKIEWPENLRNWGWKPFPDDKLVFYKWHEDMWINRPWRPPIAESRLEAPPPEQLRFPDPYWGRWAQDWLDRWNELYVRYLNDDVPKDRRSRTLDKPFQYNRIWYLQGWDATTNDNKKVRIMQYFGELTREFGEVVYIFDWILVGNPDRPLERPLFSVDWIGSRTYDQVWLPNGFDPKAITTQSTTPVAPPPKLLDWKEVPNELKRKRIFAEMDRKALETSNVCFIPAGPENDQYSMLMFAPDRASCEDRLDRYGNPKPKGVWDHSCQKDSDCIFYQANKNYPNTYGRCLENGRCQFPAGMKPLGYHYWIPGKENEPYCYNCNSSSWRPITELGKCCEEQRDKEKYPYLEGPDFAYLGDQPERERYFRETQCVTTQNGKNMNCQNRGYIPRKPILPKITPKLETIPIPPATEGYDPDDNIVPGQTDATFVNPRPQASNQ